MAAAAGVSFGGASSLAALAVSDATAFSAAFFFFFPDLGFAEVFNSVRISVSEMNNLLLDLLLVYTPKLSQMLNQIGTFILPSILCVDVHFDGSKGRPVILCGPFGIKSTVNLNCATISPMTIKRNNILVLYYY